MAWAIILIVLFVLAVILLLPVRVKGSYGQGAWSVAVYYAFIRVFHKESAPPKEPDVPPKPDEDGSPFFAPPQEEETSPAAAAAKPETLETAHPKPEPAKPEQTSAAESVSLHKPEQTAPETANASAESKPEKPAKKPKKPKKPKAEASAEENAADDNTETVSEPQSAKKKRGIRGFIERLKPHSLSDILGLAKDGCAALSPALRFLTKHLHFRHIRLYAAVASDDPADTAQLYGKICAAVYNLIGQLQCWVDLEADEVRILADFFGSKSDFRASGELRVSPAAAIVLVLILGGKFLWRTLCRFRNEDKDAKRYEKESAPLPET